MLKKKAAAVKQARKTNITPMSVNFVFVIILRSIISGA